MRQDNEIIKKVYKAQRKNPSKGDWVTLVEMDLKSLNIEFNEEVIENMSSDQFSSLIKKKSQGESICRAQCSHGRTC